MTGEVAGSIFRKRGDAMNEEQAKTVRSNVYGLWVNLPQIEGRDLSHELLAAKKRSQDHLGVFVEGRFMVEADGTAYFEWGQKK
jgi:hypothetical protein